MDPFEMLENNQFFNPSSRCHGCWRLFKNNDNETRFSDWKSEMENWNCIGTKISRYSYKYAMNTIRHIYNLHQ